MVDAHGDYESKYTEHELLGEGGFGSVYLVTHKVENKKYVAKKVKVGPDTSDLIAKLSEVKLLQDLKHPNILSCKEFFNMQDINIIIIMEYCECKFCAFIIF
jgi:serine/threonine protein kinase